MASDEKLNENLEKLKHALLEVSGKPKLRGLSSEPQKEVIRVVAYKALDISDTHLGSGRNGFVTAVSLENGESSYAVKVVPESGMKEVAFLHMCRSNYVIPIVALAHGERQCALLMPRYECTIVERMQLWYSAPAKRADGLRLRLGLKWTLQLLHALLHVHSLSVVHRDVKTANILCTTSASDCDIALADFGLACIDENHDSHERQPSLSIVGTRAYHAPEVTKGRAQGFPADVWAAGVCAFRIVTFKTPYVGMERELDAQLFSAAGLLQLAQGALTVELRERPSAWDLYTDHLAEYTQFRKQLKADPASVDPPSTASGSGSSLSSRSLGWPWEVDAAVVAQAQQVLSPCLRASFSTLRPAATSASTADSSSTDGVSSPTSALRAPLKWLRSRSGGILSPR